MKATAVRLVTEFDNGLKRTYDLGGIDLYVMNPKVTICKGVGEAFPTQELSGSISLRAAITPLATLQSLTPPPQHCDPFIWNDIRAQVALFLGRQVVSGRSVTPSTAHDISDFIDHCEKTLGAQS